MTLEDIKRVDLSKGYIPIAVAVSIAVGLLTLSFQFGSEYHGLVSEKSATSADLINVKREFEVFREGMRKDLDLIKEGMREMRFTLTQATLPEDIVRRSDIDRFCLMTERANKGFKCPDPWNR